MLKRLLLPTLLLGLTAFVLSACGSSESDEDKITDVITTSVTTTDPADCEALSTLNFMEQTNSAEGKEAVKGCEEDAEDTTNDADSVEVTDVEVDGSTATASVAFTGGSFNRQTLSVALVEEDGDWKLDEIDRFVKLDRKQLLASFEEAFEGANEAETELAECIVGALEARSDEGLEEVILGGQEGIEDVIGECQ